MDGRLINKAGCGKYSNQSAVYNVVRYITRSRENEQNAGDLLFWGGLGISECEGVEYIVDEFQTVQDAYQRKNIGRRVQHHVYSFSEGEKADIQGRNLDMDAIARKMARDFFREGYQVVYAVHQGNSSEKHMHAHFAVNTVNFRTGKKFHESKAETKAREQRFQKIVRAERRKPFIPKYR